MTETSFDDLLRGCTTSAVKVELHDSYMNLDPGYLEWKAGRPEAAVKRYADWTELARTTVERGVEMRRVRVVSEPLSDYMLFEHAVTPQVNLAAGELIRWLPRRQLAELALPGNDFWLIDDRVVMWLYFDGNGDLTGSELTEDPATASMCGCGSAFQAAWDRGIAHDGYRPQPA